MLTGKIGKNICLEHTSTSLFYHFKDSFDLKLVYLFRSYGIVSSSVPWKSITDTGLCGIWSNPKNGDPDIGAIDAIMSLISAAEIEFGITHTHT